MRVTLQQFLNKLGIEVILRPYETIPYDFFNEDKGLDVMAEVSLSGDGNTINAEIQVIENLPGGKMKFTQIMQMQLLLEKGGLFVARSLRYNGQQLAGKKANWFEGGCKFIKQSMALIKKGTVPDFENLYKTLIDVQQQETAGGSGGARGLKNPAATPPKPPGQGSGGL